MYRICICSIFQYIWHVKCNALSHLITWKQQDFLNLLKVHIPPVHWHIDMFVVEQSFKKLSRKKHLPSAIPSYPEPRKCFEHLQLTLEGCLPYPPGTKTVKQPATPPIRIDAPINSLCLNICIILCGHAPHVHAQTFNLISGYNRKIQGKNEIFEPRNTFTCCWVCTQLQELQRRLFLMLTGGRLWHPGVLCDGKSVNSANITPSLGFPHCRDTSAIMDSKCQVTFQFHFARDSVAMLNVWYHSLISTWIEGLILSKREMVGGNASKQCQWSDAWATH